MTDSEWWKQNIHVFKKNKTIRWDSDFVIAIREHGLPDGIKTSRANLMLKRMGSSYRVEPSNAWSRAELMQLRSISMLPLLKRRGWDACLRMAYRKGFGKTTARTRHTDDNKE